MGGRQGHEVDSAGTAVVPGKGGIVLEAIAGTVLRNVWMALWDAGKPMVQLKRVRFLTPEA